jgi:hypothetical protein
MHGSSMQRKTFLHLIAPFEKLLSIVTELLGNRKMKRWYLSFFHLSERMGHNFSAPI